MNDDKLLNLAGGKILYDDLRDRIKETAAEIPEATADVLRYTSQGLTEAQKEQARDNIDAVSVEQLDAEVNDLHDAVDGKVADVQVNGSSVVTDGVAEIPIAEAFGQVGLVRVNLRGLAFLSDPFDNTKKVLGIQGASDAVIKSGISYWDVLIPQRQHQSVFYGLAKAAGDTTQKSSSNAVGTYTDEAKAAIKEMLGVQDGLKVVRLI